MKTRIIAIAAVLMMALPSTNAQYNETNNLFYHTLRTPQSTLLNPAFSPANTSLFFMLPGLELNFGSPMSINDVMSYNPTTQTTYIHLDNILTCLNNNNKFNFGANINIFGFGLKLDKTVLTFNSRLINQARFGLPVETINALTQGNIDDNGDPRPVVELLNGNVLNANSYMEMSAGASHYIEPINLTVGLRAKILYGIANVQTDNTRIEFNTDPNMDSVTARMYYEIQMATFAPYDTSAHSFDINFGDMLGSANTGIAFDLGAKYDFGPFTFSLSINDLSAGIHWTNNVTTWQPQGGQGVIEFNGMELNTMLNSGNFNVDSLTNYLENQLSAMTPVRKDSGDYWFSIPTKINLGASYNFAKMFRAGILFHGQFDRGLLSKSNDRYYENAENTFRFNTTLTCGASFFNWIEAIVGNSIVYDGESMDLFNPGIGVILTPGTFFQIYLMSDYISSFYLTDAKAFNVKFGVNLLFGNGGREVVAAE